MSLMCASLFQNLKRGATMPDKKLTNYDRIRNMSVEEIAEFMQKCGWDFPPYCDYQKATRGICDQNCLKCAKQYLESEVDNNG